MLQMSIFSEERPIKVCVFTGHRDLQSDFSKKKLKEAVKEVIDMGADTFLCGMAMGFDLIAAETVLSLKRKFPHIKLVACIPCVGQEKYFSNTDKRRYVAAVEKADKRVVLSDSYYRGCMQARDRYMADRGDILITYCKKQEGGTAYTVHYFQKVNPEGKIIFL
nr:DUF1273 family protein [Clostridia bacterium]